MNRRSILGVSAIALLRSAVFTSTAIAQQGMLKEQGTTTATLEISHALAPAGRLRVGVYPCSPFSMVRDAVSGDMKGIAVELGKARAMRLDVP